MIENYTILTQPDDITCGPTCLQSIYNYYGDNLSLQETIQQTESLTTGGTLAVLLGCHALTRGYQVRLHSFNTDILDPSWFKLKNISLIDKLNEQAQTTDDKKIRYISEAYNQFISLGGNIIFNDLSFQVIQTYLNQGHPLLSGVNATYFYQTMREYTNDDLRSKHHEFLGEASGHFIVLYRSNNENDLHIADPYTPHPLSTTHHYTTSYNHWLHAFLLGTGTSDAELLVIIPSFYR
jgi:hypothetical protein